MICGFANATTDGLEKNYIFFGVSDLNEFMGIEDDLNFLKNDQNEAKIVDRIIQFIREKLDILLGKSEVAKYIKIFERFHIRYKKRIILLEIKKSEEPLFIKFDHKIFAKASKKNYKNNPETLMIKVFALDFGLEAKEIQTIFKVLININILK